MAIKILVNYFFSKINIFSPRNTENDNLTETCYNRTSFNYFSTPPRQNPIGRPPGGGGGGPADWILPGGLTDLKKIGLNLKYVS